jgi:hypothetical protein
VNGGGRGKRKEALGGSRVSLSNKKMGNRES